MDKALRRASERNIIIWWCGPVLHIFSILSLLVVSCWVIPLSQQKEKRMDEEKKTLAKIVFYFALGALGFRNAQWFNSAEPMRSYYKFYVLVLILAQYFGMKSGQKLFEESQKIKSD